MLLGFRAAPMFPHKQPRFTLFGEALEDRCLLSANPQVNFTIQNVEIYDKRAYSSRTVEPSSTQLQQGVFVTEALVDGASMQPAQGDYLGSTSLPVTTEPGSTDENFDENLDENFDNDKIVPLIAVQPDDSIDPFVDCPGLDEEFCLPDEIDFDFDIDFLDALIFGTSKSALTWLDNSFDKSDRVGHSDFLFSGDRYF